MTLTFIDDVIYYVTTYTRARDNMMNERCEAKDRARLAQLTFNG